MSHERLSLVNVYEQAVGILGQIEDREDYIRKIIIPEMDRYEERKVPLSKEDIEELFYGGHEKISFDTDEDSRVTLALWMAKEVFLNLQPNRPKSLSPLNEIVDIFDIEMETALAFCIIRYRTLFLCKELGISPAPEKEIVKLFLNDPNKEMPKT